jgi:ankyrin repeat protein
LFYLFNPFRKGQKTSNDCDIFAINNFQDNALNLAAFSNKADFITHFLKYEKEYIATNFSNDDERKRFKNSLNVENNKKKTPLLTAIEAGNHKAVEAIISTGEFDLNATDEFGNTIYHLCAQYSNLDSLRYLLSRKKREYIQPLFNTNNFKDTVIHVACKYNNLDALKQVVNKIRDNSSSMELKNILLAKDEDEKNCFHIACERGYLNIVEYLLNDLKASYFVEELDGDSNTPLHLATINNNLEIGNFLINNTEASINAKNKKDKTALEISCRNQNYELSKNILTNYKTITIEEFSENPLHIACDSGSHKIVELLLSKGFNIDALDKHGFNCLDISINKQNTEVIGVLLKHVNWHLVVYSGIGTGDEQNSNIK